VASTDFLVLPTTNDVLTWRVVNTGTNHIISRHRNLRLSLDKAKQLNIESAATARLGEIREEGLRCGYQDDRYVYPCGAPARSPK
jgi:hypothetical protein